MRHISFVVLLAFAVSIPIHAQTQTSSEPPQTARQALIEMFLGKNADAFAKHLPELARQALMRKGETPETSMVGRISMIGRQMTQGEHVETFDLGSTLLVSEQPDGHEKYEVVVEHDYLMGEQDEIELSIQVYRDGQLEFLPVIPRLIFTMTQEKEIWRLSEATLAVHVPLTDPNYLTGVRKKADELNENIASVRVNMMTSAESNYAAAHPDKGYTCNLADLVGKTNPTNSQFQRDSAAPDPSSDESNGYLFSVTGCDGNPARKFQITAVPVETDSGMKSFCSDQTGTVRFEAGGKGSACLSRGQVLDPGLPPGRID